MLYTCIQKWQFCFCHLGWLLFWKNFQKKNSVFIKNPIREQFQNHSVLSLLQYAMKIAYGIVHSSVWLDSRSYKTLFSYIKNSAYLTESQFVQHSEIDPLTF